MKKLLTLFLAWVILAMPCAYAAESVEYEAAQAAIAMEIEYGLKNSRFDWEHFEEKEAGIREIHQGGGVVTTLTIIAGINSNKAYDGVNLSEYMGRIILDEVWVVYHSVPNEDSFRLEWFMGDEGGYSRIAFNPESGSAFFDYHEGRIADMGNFCANLKSIVKQTGASCEYTQIPKQNINQAIAKILDIADEKEAAQ